jgi:Uma2 family endonuclease
MVGLLGLFWGTDTTKLNVTPGRYRGVMRAVILEVDERMLAERERLGLDRRDEMWEGVLHMVPQPSGRHQVMGTALARYLFDPAARRGCEVATEIGVYAADRDYRVPDVAVFPQTSRSDRGVDGPLLVAIEILSPGDESYDKVPWYQARGAGSVVIVDQATFSVEIFGAEGKVESDADGLTAIAGLGARLGPAPDGEGLLIETEDGANRIRG